MPKAAAAPVKQPKKSPVVDRDTLLLRELEKTKQTLSDVSDILSKSLAAVVTS